MKSAPEQHHREDEVIEPNQEKRQAANERPVSDSRDSLRWLFDDRRERGRRMHFMPFVKSDKLKRC